MSLAGLTILLVEDEPVIALSLEDLFLDAGAEPLVAGSIAEAQRITAEVALDAALLDVNVGGETSYSLASVLLKRGVPFAFATGYGNSMHGEQFSSVPTVAKPYSLAEIEEALARARWQTRH